MYIVKRKNTDNYLSKGQHFNKLVLKNKARVFKSIAGARKSITYGLLKENAHLLNDYEIIKIDIIMKG